MIAKRLWLAVSLIVALAAPCLAGPPIPVSTYGRRWTAELLESGGSTATLHVRVRSCSAERYTNECRGGWQCEGAACPGRRGRFIGEFLSDLLSFDFFVRRAYRVEGRPFCGTDRPAPGGEDGFEYSCFVHTPSGEPNRLVRQGTLSMRRQQ